MYKLREDTEEKEHFCEEKKEWYNTLPLVTPRQNCNTELLLQF